MKLTISLFIYSMIENPLVIVKIDKDYKHYAFKHEHEQLQSRQWV